ERTRHVLLEACQPTVQLDARLIVMITKDDPSFLSSFNNKALARVVVRERAVKSFFLRGRRRQWGVIQRVYMRQGTSLCSRWSFLNHDRIKQLLHLTQALDNVLH
ncbi:MAG: hypothetical protein MJE68_25795, partial [Proteobacteria bacterium]|nr:hypothetical protein [Pseudomonadota bacterium]